MTHYIVHADDFGISRETSACIREAHINGCLDRTSILANGECFEYAARLLKENPRLCWSLHIDLIEGRALSGRHKVPDLVDSDGCFKHSFMSLWIRYLFHRKKRDDLLKQIEEEIGNQISKVRNALGCEGITVDSHRYVHMLPFVWKLLNRMAEEWDIKSMRTPIEPFFLVQPFYKNVMHWISGNLVKHLILNWLSKRAIKTIRSDIILHPDYVIGILFGGSMSLDVLRAAIKKLMKGQLRADAVIEILFHPGQSHKGDGRIKKGVRRYDRYYASENRNREFQTLLSPEMKRFMRELGSYRNA